MSKREHTHKKPNLDRDDRIYGALTFKPFKHTSLILQGERVNRGWNSAIRMPPADFVSLWLNADQISGSGYTTARPVYDNTSFTNIASNLIFVRAADVPVLANDGSPMRSWLNSVTVKNPVRLPGTNQTYDAGANHTINDPSIFPFDVSITGTGRTTMLGGMTKTAMVEQRLAPDLHLELAYNREKTYTHRLRRPHSRDGHHDRSDRASRHCRAARVRRHLQRRILICRGERIAALWIGRDLVWRTVGRIVHKYEAIVLSRGRGSR